MDEFKLFIEENSGWFRSEILESNQDILYYENEIGFNLPEEMKWLLTEYGYSEACGIENLSSCVFDTKELRNTINLPDNVLVLAEWEHGGVILMMSGGNEIISCEKDDLVNYAETNAFPETIYIFDDYAMWVRFRWENEFDQDEL